MVLETEVQSEVKSYQKEMVLYAFLFNNHHYNVLIKGKWSNSRKGVMPSLAIEKEPLGYPQLQSANLLICCNQMLLNYGQPNYLYATTKCYSCFGSLPVAANKLILMLWMIPLDTQ